MKHYTTHSETETEQLAQSFSNTLCAGDVVAYRGGLGAGKTAFTRGLAAGLGTTDPVASPTFAIVHVYRGGRLLLAHFDMYRITTPEALEDTGYYDYIHDPAGVVYAVEWSEHIHDALPDTAIFVDIEPQQDTTRRITIHERGTL